MCPEKSRVDPLSTSSSHEPDLNIQQDRTGALRWGGAAEIMVQDHLSRTIKDFLPHLAKAARKAMKAHAAYGAHGTHKPTAMCALGVENWVFFSSSLCGDQDLIYTPEEGEINANVLPRLREALIACQKDYKKANPKSQKSGQHTFDARCAEVQVFQRYIASEQYRGDKQSAEPPDNEPDIYVSTCSSSSKEPCNGNGGRHQTWGCAELLPKLGIQDIGMPGPNCDWEGIQVLRTEPY